MNANFPDAEVKIAKGNVANSSALAKPSPGSWQTAPWLGGDVWRPSANQCDRADAKRRLSNTTPEDLRREFARRFQPKQAVLVVVGSFDATAGRVSLRQEFQSWKAAGSESVTEPPKAHSPAGADGLPGTMRGIGADHFASGRGRARAPLRTGEASEVANAIYEECLGSRLVLNIREDKGYA